MSNARMLTMFVAVVLSAAFGAAPKAKAPPVGSHSRALQKGVTPPTRKSVAASLAFAPVVDYSAAGTGAAFVTVADVNGDGKPDLLVSGALSDGSGMVSVLLGNGDGTFQPSVNFYTGGNYATFLAVGDVNGDGKLDIVASNECPTTGGQCTSGIVGVLLGNGDGTFQRASTFSSGQHVATSIALADLNRDGKLDIIVTNQDQGFGGGGGSVGVLLGNGDGTFQSVNIFSSGGNGASTVVLADVNGDGLLDALVTNNGHGTMLEGVGVLLGDGDGTFRPAVLYNSFGGNSVSVAVGDVNGDGKLDAVLATSITQGGGMAVFLGNGDGTFQLPTSFYSGGSIANSVALADVNGDNILDALVANFSPGSGGDSTVGVLLGNGDGTFQAASTFDSGGYIASFASANDVNGDGRPDLLAANASRAAQGSIGVLLNLNVFTTTSTLTSSVNPASFGQSVVLTATARPQSGNGTPTGTMSFLDGTTVLGSVALSNGQGSLTTSSLAVGIHSLTAAYSGDGSFAASTSAVLNQTIQGAIGSVSPANLNFGNVTVGKTASLSATLTNTGNAGLSVSSITTSVSAGVTSESDTCPRPPATLAAGQSCVPTVTWQPSSAISMTGSLTISDNATNGSQVVALSGTGVTPSVQLSPSSLTFATQVVNTSSAGQTITLTNVGLGSLDITKITASRQFTQTNNCGSSVAAGSSCTITVKFKPTKINVITGTISVTDTASGSPQKVSLSGTGTYIQLSPLTENFGNQPVGTTSLPKKITLSNKGSVSVNLTSISITGADLGDFLETNTCGASVAAGASCFITVTFTPAAKGKRTGNVSVSDNGGGSPQTVSLTGTGT